MISNYLFKVEKAEPNDLYNVNQKIVSQPFL